MYLKLFSPLWVIKNLSIYFGSGSSGSDTTTVQKADPWSGVQPYITDYLSKGQQVTNQPYQFYNGDTIAGFSPEQELGFNLTTQRALNGSPTLNAANQNITDTLNGNYMSPDSNPWFQNTVNQALDNVSGRINSQFNNNNFGGSAHQETLQRGLSNAANQMYANNYDNERARQLQASTQAPTLANADYMDSQYLQGVGAQRQGLSQQYLTDAQNQFNNAANFPYQQLDRYGNVVSIGQGAGGTTTSSTNADGSSNSLAGAIGGGLTGYGLASKLPAAWGINPWLGAGLGLLGGLASG